MFQLYNPRVTVDKGDWLFDKCCQVSPKGIHSRDSHEKVFLMNEIGDRITDLRKARDMSLRQLAEVSGISHNQIHKYEKGVSVPHRNSVLLLAKFFAVKPTWLLFGRDVEATDADSIQEEFSLLKEGGKQMIKDNIAYLLSEQRNAEKGNGEI